MAKRFKSRSTKYVKEKIKNFRSSKLNQYKTPRIDSTKKEKYRRKLKTNKLVKFILFVICLLVFIFSIVNLLRWFIYNKKSENLIQEIVKNDFKETTEENINTKTNPVNFENLKELNEDVVGWIKIENTTINYPIVQAENNEYYLKNDLNKKYSTCGWIFMNFKNNTDFSDRNTTIFGHNMKSGLMFKDLLKIYGNELGNDVTIQIYTENEKREYAVFSSYMIEPEEYATQILTTDEQQEEYISKILERSTITYNIVPNKNDKLITLSTCDNSGKNRFLIHGVYVGGESY